MVEKLMRAMKDRLQENVRPSGDPTAAERYRQALIKLVAEASAQDLWEARIRCAEELAAMDRAPLSQAEKVENVKLVVDSLLAGGPVLIGPSNIIEKGDSDYEDDDADAEVLGRIAQQRAQVTTGLSEDMPAEGAKAAKAAEIMGVAVSGDADDFDRVEAMLNEDEGEDEIDDADEMRDAIDAGREEAREALYSWLRGQAMQAELFKFGKLFRLRLMVGMKVSGPDVVPGAKPLPPEVETLMESFLKGLRGGLTKGQQEQTGPARDGCRGNCDGGCHEKTTDERDPASAARDAAHDAEQQEADEAADRAYIDSIAAGSIGDAGKAAQEAAAKVHAEYAARRAAVPTPDEAPKPN